MLTFPLPLPKPPSPDLAPSPFAPRPPPPPPPPPPSYYPKLQAAVPFTPVTGPRLLVSGSLADGSRRAVVRALGRALVSLAGGWRG